MSISGNLTRSIKAHYAKLAHENAQAARRAESEVTQAMKFAAWDRAEAEHIQSPPEIHRYGVTLKSGLYEPTYPWNHVDPTMPIMSPVDLDDEPVDMSSPADRDISTLPRLPSLSAVSTALDFDNAVALQRAPNGATMAMDEAGNVVGVRPPPGVDVRAYVAACKELQKCFVQCVDDLVPDLTKRATIDRLYPIVCGKPYPWPPAKKARRSSPQSSEQQKRRAHVEAAVAAAREAQKAADEAAEAVKNMKTVENKDQSTLPFDRVTDPNEAKERLYDMFCPDTGAPDADKLDQIEHLYVVAYGKAFSAYSLPSYRTWPEALPPLPAISSPASPAPSTESEDICEVIKVCPAAK